ncbi:peptidase S41 [Emticicia oligotrophica DSM 17448]|uniref:Peptidase S41 n=1 Tax=Emticicia oligotrophica (strain DSM 17448 / CIP 109782 / MTCC 6937 / GPTSA100-15) TaxID=929562 RepID=A0ABN4ADU3_EMTOG|nr:MULTISPECIES: S41 family peptidase [Emticicia]AFK01807.1 peptidase S41 [Emticicia oligotrophica DSM 17448]
MEIKLGKILLICLVMGAFSCKKDTLDPASNTTSTSGTTNNSNTTTNTSAYAAANSWVYDQMKAWYLWADQMPAKEKTNLNLVTGKDGQDDVKTYYFYSLLNDYPNTDRFSWIRENITDLTNSLSGVSTAFGFSRTAVYLDNTQTNVVFFISNVVLGSPAEKAGLKRGDIILTINGTQINGTNYATLIANNETATFGLGEFKNGTYVLSGKTITATKAVVQNNPIQFTKVIEKGNKKIGYLVYTQFLDTYDEALKQAFAQFKAAGVNEFVLDLRMNGGGRISSADLLSSLLVKNPSVNNVIHRDEWNSAVVAKYPSVSTPTKFTLEPNNLNLGRLFVLTSNGTASASELVINGLRPYMDVIIIGQNTYGKNVGSITISDDQKRWTWGMQPIVLRTLNSKGESNYGTKNGFAPDYVVSDNIYPFKPWGDETETLLKKALEVITGATIPADASSRRSYRTLNTQVLEENISDNPADNNKDMFAKLPKQ